MVAVRSIRSHGEWDIYAPPKARYSIDMKDKQWLVLRDDEWLIVLPDNDIQPHSKLVLNYPDGKKEADLAGWDCPCKPQVNFRDKMIVHNAFDGRE